MIVAISGLSGCGNTTISDLVAKKLGLKKINYTLRDMAKEKGMAFEALHAKAETEFPAIDLELDKKLLSMASGDCVLGTRLAVWMVDSDLRIWVHASPRTRAKRIAEREGGKPDVKAVKARDAANAARYRKLYGINVKKHEDVCDLEINDEAISAEKATEIIVAAARQLPFAKKKSKWPKKIRKVIDEKTKESR